MTKIVAKKTKGAENASTSPFHEGEQRIQTKLRVRDEIEPWARQVVHAALPDQHREFYAQLPFLVISARDDHGHPWVTLLAGEPGFAHSPNSSELAIAIAPAVGDPLHDAIQCGDDVGILGIEPHTRRRNRVNGRVSQRDRNGFRLEVDQGFGNCPKHITERTARPVSPSPRASHAERSNSLSDAAQRWIANADTFFVGTGFRGRGESVTYGMDASHRGGPPGFVRVLDGQTLLFDDYAGNNHYNTLGNLDMDARASLLFVEFERGSLLHLRGRATVLWQGDQRTIRFELDEAVERPHALALRWSDPRADRRKLRVAAIRRESEDVRSFTLQPQDGQPLAPFRAGQYLPVSLSIPAHTHPVERTYSLSNAPSDLHYRISVKRERQGLMSRHLHDEVRVGEVLAAGPPTGAFVLQANSTRPAALVSAGVGVTPMVAMLHALGETAIPVVFVHGTRDGQHHSLRDEVRAVVDANPNARLHVAYSRPQTRDVEGRDYHSAGRVTTELLLQLLPGLDADFYFCGPAAFLADLQRGLGEAGVPNSQINTESF
jgi:ferredoxin-NADP reductase/predicted pyridoxine 5'-phosphate oxidase superfamily flavin-nucleotide-binding protein